MHIDEIERIHKEHWRVGWGSVAVDEVDVMQGLIREHRPRTFIEVGTASGLSGGLICKLMDENGGERFVTIDHDNTFFGDTSKENGWLMPLIYPEGRVEVVRRPFTTATDVADETDTYEMGFVDANHQHPWPLMDTMCLYPHMSGPKILMHHDLDLYRKQQPPVYGIGPKYFYDQFPQTHRWRASANNGNLFWVSLDVDQETFEAMCCDAFALPWSLRTALQGKRLDVFRAVLRRHYSPRVLEVFDENVARFNKAITPAG